MLSRATTRGFHDIFPQLKNLDVSHNRIEQFSDLSDLRFNLHLKTLQLHVYIVMLYCINVNHCVGECCSVAERLSG